MILIILLNTILDYTSANSLTMDRGPSTTVFIGRNSETRADLKAYEVSFKIEDDSIHNGKTCTDYSKQNSNYDECIVASFEKQVVSQQFWKSPLENLLSIHA